MCVCARLLLLAALPALAGRAAWCVGGEVVAGGARGPPGPAFLPRQATAAVAAVGQAASLDCRVLRLRDKSVSWVRSRDLQILTHAGNVFTADARVAAAEARGSEAQQNEASASRHSLRIEKLRTSDTGRYECQINTEPKMSLFFNLTVLDEPVPAVEVRAARGGVRGARGGAATLACAARYEPAPRALPLPPLDVRWRRASAAGPLQLQRSRGGVSLDTERWAWRVVSRLTLADLREDDAGRYECSAGAALPDTLPGADHSDTLPGAALPDILPASDTIVLHVDAEEHMEMQRDESASSAGRAGPAAAGDGPRLLGMLALLALAPL